LESRPYVRAPFRPSLGTRGSHAERDIRGFALKFYTEDGNWDIVGNNTPVFSPRSSPLSDLNHAIKRDPVPVCGALRITGTSGLFFRSTPPGHNLMSDRGIPKSFRHMHASESHFLDDQCREQAHLGEVPTSASQQGIENLTDEAAAAVVANIGRATAEIYWSNRTWRFSALDPFHPGKTEEQAKTHKHNPLI